MIWHSSPTYYDYSKACPPAYVLDEEHRARIEERRDIHPALPGGAVNDLEIQQHEQRL